MGLFDESIDIRIGGHKMFAKLLLLFTVVPFVELYLLLKVASMTSATTTILIVIGTGVVGAYLAKKEGRAVLRKISVDLRSFQMPGDTLIEGLCILVGGALLVTPGIITDFFGFTLVIPFTRFIYKDYIKNKFRGMINSGKITFWR